MKFKFKSVRVKLETYNNLILIQKSLHSRNIEEKLVNIMDTSIKLLRCIVERKVEVDISKLMKVDPLLSLKLLSYIYGKVES